MKYFTLSIVMAAGATAFPGYASMAAREVDGVAGLAFPGFNSLIGNRVRTRGEAPKVQPLPTEIHGADKGALPHVPATLPSDMKAFLDKYQPYSNKAMGVIGSVNNDHFSKSGHCWQEYPCFSVERPAVTTIGNKEEVKKDQVSAILDSISGSPTVEISQTNSGNPYNSFVKTQNGATLQVIAPKGTVDSNLLTGMVFDMFKLQSDDASTNAVRAIQAQTDGKARPFLAICLYPEGADKVSAFNFCIGDEQNGSPTPLDPSQNSKRFSLEETADGLMGFGCSLIHLPIVCA
ncbi:hypothetical protein K491DRAFT_682226 [Lophiostoma macrostomum CBS 122681]|uniref:Uncharacterized protein n=1 Tax=Lophiostoma macrostomum CBS 122681 TaxID=1314788 RepID=A0A6A6SUA3_9PLEO|nr:hypothetical protein K491DRAFT_682226 [Lophiostoma macrostomum CBS 122681]